MAEGFNKAILVGNVGADPDLKENAGGNSMLRIRMATTENYLDRDKNRQQRTEWHTVIVWGKRAEGLGKILSKGRTICVEGRIQTRQWETDSGEKRSTTEINASNVYLVGGRPQGEGGQFRGPAQDSFGGGEPFGDGNDPF